MTFNPTPEVSCKYGAPMGRPTRHGIVTDETAQWPFRLVRVRLNSGGYDAGGAYWGCAEPLYYYEGPLSDISGYVRGRTREHAKAVVRATHPKAKFHR